MASNSCHLQNRFPASPFYFVIYWLMQLFCVFFNLPVPESWSYYIPRRKSGIYWFQVRRAAAAVHFDLCAR